MILRIKSCFFENVGEKVYTLDRVLNHLTQAGIFNQVKGIIFGEFAQTNEDTLFAIQRFAMNTKIPVFKTDQFDHGKKNYPTGFNV